MSLREEKPLDKRATKFEEVYRINPGCGMAIIFEQDDPSLLHEGEEIRSGFKYMIRTDIMYEPESPVSNNDDYNEAVVAFYNL